MVDHRRGTIDAGTDAVQVVLADIEHRQVPDLGHVQGFMESALVVGGIAEEADGDLVAALHLDGLGHTGGQREGTAHQGIAAHEMVLRIENVHGAAATLAAAGLLAEQLGHHGLGVGTAFDGMDMVAVAGDDVVMTRARGFHDAETAGLLAGVEMEEASNLAFHIGFVATLLEAAREQHFAQQPFLVGGIHGAPYRSTGGRWRGSPAGPQVQVLQTRWFCLWSQGTPRARRRAAGRISARLPGQE
jgi:hypothetical protein